MTHLFIMLPVVAAMLATTASAQQKSTEAPHYVGSASCAACHATESAAWEGSDHALAWTEPSPDTVLGDFDDAETTLDGARVRLSTEGGAYMVSITRPDGTEARYPVHSVAGVRPLQQYLLETEPGRLQSFDLAWDTRGAAVVRSLPRSGSEPRRRAALDRSLQELERALRGMPRHRLPQEL
ncbi:hypothetical protein ACFOHS_16285 [Jhaorihella thermophila]